MKKLDLHTHSVASPDGGLQAAQYRDMLQSGSLDVIAVTDHNTIEIARQLHAELGDSIIVGEEISTQAGDLIGIYLKDPVPPGLTAEEAVRRIHEQGGLAYLPHPFDRWRHSAGARLRDQLAEQIDIVEIYNGRMLRRQRNNRARVWAAAHGLPGAASSDAHGPAGWGSTYTVVAELPSVQTLPQLLRQATYQTRPPGFRAVLYPKANRLRKQFGRA